MLDKKGQFELEPMPALLAIIGGVAAFIMAGGMGTNFIMRIIITLITTVVCYFIASMGSR